MDRQVVDMLALIFSFFVPGLGQAAKGHWLRGGLIFFATVVLALSVIVLIGIVLLPLFWLFNIHDAWKLKPKNREEN